MRAGIEHNGVGPQLKVIAVLPPERPPYEASWLEAMPDVTLQIVHDSFGYRVCELSRFSRIFSSTAAWLSYEGLEDLLVGADVVLTVEAFSAQSLQVASLARKLRFRHVVMCWEVLAAHPIYSLPPFRSAFRAIVASDAAFVAVTQTCKSHLVQRGVAESRIDVVYPGVPAQANEPSQGERGPRRLFFAGLLEPHKGISDMLAAFTMYRAEHCDATLHVAGKGSLVPALRQPGVKYLGFLNRSELLEEYSAADVSVLLSTRIRRFGIDVGAEQFGYAIVDGMMAGNAILTTNVGALPEVVGDPAQIVPPSHPDAALSLLQEWNARPSAFNAIRKRNRQRANALFDIRQQGSRLRMTLERRAEH